MISNLSSEVVAVHTRWLEHLILMELQIHLNNTTNKYSRNLMPTSYSSTTTNPLFFIEGDYDNTILRTNRNIGSGLETGARRTIDIIITFNNENRFEGKGVGPNGGFTLFGIILLTHLLITSRDIDTSTVFDQYPFVNGGTAPDYTQSYDHTTLLHDGTTAAAGANRQLIWAEDGFKAEEVELQIHILIIIVNTGLDIIVVALPKLVPVYLILEKV